MIMPEQIVRAAGMGLPPVCGASYGCVCFLPAGIINASGAGRNSWPSGDGPYACARDLENYYSRMDLNKLQVKQGQQIWLPAVMGGSQFFYEGGRLHAGLGRSMWGLRGG